MSCEREILLSDQGPRISRLVYGTWRLLQDSSNEPLAALERKISTCFELGITTFDHADIYGDYQVEAFFGRFLKANPSLRPKMQLISKAGIKLVSPQRPAHQLKTYDTSQKHLTQSAENSLKALNTDYLDLFLVHRPDPLMDFDDTAKGLEQLVTSGKARFVGVSNFLPWQLKALRERLTIPLVTNQIEINPLRPEPFLDGSLAQCQSLNIRPMAWSPLAGGGLFADAPAANRIRDCLNTIAPTKDASISQLVLAWLLRHPAGIVPIIGSLQESRIRDAVHALELPLERDEWFAIWTAMLGHDIP